MESLEESSPHISQEMTPQVSRILPIDQDRTKQIRSVIPPEIRIFQDIDFDITKSDMVVDHKFGNTEDNDLQSLQIISQRANTLKGGMSNKSGLISFNLSVKL